MNNDSQKKPKDYSKECLLPRAQENIEFNQGSTEKSENYSALEDQ